MLDTRKVYLENDNPIQGLVNFESTVQQLDARVWGQALDFKSISELWQKKWFMLSRVGNQILISHINIFPIHSLSSANNRDHTTPSLNNSNGEKTWQ